MRNSWCETCARKYQCYDIEVRPSCYVPVTNTAVQPQQPPQLDESLYKFSYWWGEIEGAAGHDPSGANFEEQKI